MELSFINSEIIRLISQPETAYLAGVFAAFTPCTFTLIPIFLYRFGIWGGKKENPTPLKKEIGLFVIGFIVSFLVFGLVLANLFGGGFINVTRLTLGTVLVFIGVLQAYNQLSLQLFTKITNPFLLGVTMPAVISLSPCVLPILSPIVATSVNFDALIKLLLFGIGVLTPAVLIGFGGNRLLRNLSKVKAATARIEQLSAGLIVLSGFFLSAQLIKFTAGEIVLSSLLLSTIYLFITYRILRSKQLRTVRNLLSVFVVSLVWITVIVFTTSQGLNSDSLNASEYLYACTNLDDHFTTQSYLVSGSYVLVALLWAKVFAHRFKKGRIINFTFSQPDQV